jgi:type IV pilus assembly protein PilA
MIRADWNRDVATTNARSPFFTTTTTTTSEIVNMLNLKRRITEARKADEGFTLIELAVVILIIGILLLLAIPSFLGVRKKAQDKAAQSALKVMLTNAKAIYGDGSNFLAADATAMAAAKAEPGYNLIGGQSTGPKNVSINVNTAGTNWSAAAWSASSKCFLIQDSDASGTKFGTTATATSCTGTFAAANANNDGW